MESQRDVRACGPSPRRKFLKFCSPILLLGLPVDITLKECSCILKSAL